MYKNKNFIDSISIFFATFFYVGYFPYGPGTAGTFVSMVLYFLFFHYLTFSGYIILCIVLFFAGIFFSSRAEKIIGKKDPSEVVIDEVEGYLITMLGAFWAPFSILYVLIGFLLFRIFDIIKPFPIGAADKRIGGGIGIMLDDVIAAVISAVLLRLIIVIIVGL